MNINLENLITEYSPMVHSICRRMIRDENLAMDAFQESWYNIIKGVDGFKGNSKISTWIYAIASRTAVRMAKNEKRFSIGFLEAFFDSRKDMEIEAVFNDREEEKIWIKEQCTKCLDGILHCLDNEERVIYILKDVINLGYGEISEITDKNPAALRKMNSRNRHKLRNFLEDHCMLFNTESRCYCKLKKAIDKSEMKSEITKLRKTLKDIFEYCSNDDVKNAGIHQTLDVHCKRTGN